MAINANSLAAASAYPSLPAPAYLSNARIELPTSGVPRNTSSVPFNAPGPRISPPTSASCFLVTCIPGISIATFSGSGTTLPATLPPAADKPPVKAAAALPPRSICPPANKNGDAGVGSNPNPVMISGLKYPKVAPIPPDFATSRDLSKNDFFSSFLGGSETGN